jgi:hypothetical protein
MTLPGPIGFGVTRSCGPMIAGADSSAIPIGFMQATGNAPISPHSAGEFSGAQGVASASV